MLLIADIIRKQLKKKRLSIVDLCNRINKLELGEGLTRPQNVCNMLSGQDPMSPILVKKIEIALNLPKDSLMRILPEYFYSNTQERIDEVERRKEAHCRNKQGNKKENK